MTAPQQPLSRAELLELRRWNTPTIFNGWEQITDCDVAREGVNLEPTTDYMPQMGPMVGYAVTAVFKPSDRAYAESHPDAWRDYRRYVGSVPGPKIIVCQDLDKPHHVGSFWGEVTSNTFRALDCVGTIVDGCIRDVEEMCYAGFKALASRLAVGHAYSTPVSWGEPVEVFGRRIEPGRLIHADKHGFLAVPFGDEAGLLEAARFMDANECRTMIPAARSCAGLATQEKLDRIDAACEAFGRKVRERFGRGGEF